MAFLYRHFCQWNFDAPNVDLTGKVAIVTGSNAGNFVKLFPNRKT